MTPGQAELARRELGLADQALRAARLVLEHDAPEDSVSRAYYAAFHAARAALIVHGRRAKTHLGTIRLFHETFGVNPVLSRLYQMRAEADYAMEPFARSPAEVAAAIDEAASLVHRCRGIVGETVAAGPDEPDPLPDR